MPARALPPDLEVAQLYRDGMSTTEIGDQYSVSSQAVQKALKRVGEPCRDPSQAAMLAARTRKRRVVGTKLLPELVCRKCGAAWKSEPGHTVVPCPECGALKDARDRRGRPLDPAEKAAGLKRLSTYRSSSNSRESWLRLRRRVFYRIAGTSKPRCNRCGVPDIRVLEINHKDGGGGRELAPRGRGSTRFYWDIALGRRGVDDLELLCRPCNAIHALELKFGPLGARVVWND